MGAASGAARRPPRRRVGGTGVAALVVLAGVLVPAVGPASGAATVTRAPAVVRLAGATVPVVSGPDATPVAAPPRSAQEPLTVTLTLRRSHQAAFDRYLAAVQDPSSTLYHQYLTQSHVTRAFGPSRAVYAAARSWLASQGFTSVRGSADRLTVSATASRSVAERAFRTPIADYRVGSRTVFANTLAPALPSSLAGGVEAVSGLDDVARPTAAPVSQNVPSACAAGGAPPPAAAVAHAGGGSDAKTPCDGVLNADCARFKATSEGLWVALIALICAIGFHSDPTSTLGAGQTVGLLEYDTFHPSDVQNYFSLAASDPGRAANVTEVGVNGGVASPGPGEGEVLLDIDTTLLVAPAAHVVVYDAPPNTSFEQLFNAMIAGGSTVISNSWAQCENDTSPAEAQAIDSVLAQAAASGISVLNGTGDGGSTCLDGSANTVSVPADSPNATAVGGTSVSVGPGVTYGSESWWNGSASQPPTGQGGYGVSADFPRPSFQNGLTTATGRSVPDVVAPADPVEGMAICQADAGGCPDGKLTGGTSMAAPEWAALTAALNGLLGHDLGDLNAALYPLAGTSAFHTSAELGSDFAHVGLGDADAGPLLGALSHSATGPVDPATSSVVAFGAQSPLNIDGTTVPADGTSQGILQVNLAGTAALGAPVPGKSVALVSDAGCHATIAAPSGPSDVSGGAVTFAVTDTSVETCQFSATDATDGVDLPSQPSLHFVAPAATGGAIAGTPTPPTTVPADGTSTGTVTVTLDNAQHSAAGKTVTLSQGAGHAGISGTGVTDASGQASFTVTDTVAEHVTFTATDVTDGNLPVPGSAEVDFGTGTTTCDGGSPQAHNGAAVSTAAVGFPVGPLAGVGNCVGTFGAAFDSADTMYVANQFNGVISRVPSGSSPGATAAHLPDALPAGVDDLAFGPDGSLYAPEPAQGEVVRLDPQTGAVLQVVASGLFWPAWIAADPVTGDLFVTNGGTGANFTPDLWRITDPSGSTPGLSIYYNADSNGFIQPAVSPDGTLYVLARNAKVISLGKTTGAGSPTETDLVAVPSGSDGLALGPLGPGGTPTSVDVSGNGTISEVAVPSGTVTQLMSGADNGGGPIEVKVGPDGCLYAPDVTQVLRVTGPSGTCSSTPANGGPRLTLTTDASGSPPTGSSIDVTASLADAGATAGLPVHFLVVGANQRPAVVNAGAAGTAVLSYAAIRSGTDTVVATATVGSTTYTSNPVTITWSSGKDTSFVSMNTSPQGGPVGSAVALRADLVDISGSAPVPIVGASVVLSLGSAQCSATTDGTGVATCDLTPTTAGLLAQRASYAGSSSDTASDASSPFVATSGGSPLSVTTTSLSEGTDGLPYSAHLDGAGGTPPYRWSLAPGSALPHGLVLSSAGVISGTPTAAGTTTVTVDLSDASVPGQLASRSLSLTVRPGTVPPVTTVDGYWLAAADGGVFSFGGAGFYGSMGSRPLNRPIVGMAATPDGRGYWLAASDGGIFAFGDAGFYGSTGGDHLNAPVVAMAATPDGGGYWLLASDGGIFAFGDASFFGSTGSRRLNAPVVAMASTPGGRGYVLVASDGGVFAFGDATFYGSMGGHPLDAPVVGVATTPDRRGYWLDASDGGIFAFGDASFFGTMGGRHLNRPVVGMAAVPDGAGYWLDASDGGIFAFGDATFYGSAGGLSLHAPMVTMAASPVASIIRAGSRAGR